MKSSDSTRPTMVILVIRPPCLIDLSMKFKKTFSRSTSANTNRELILVTRLVVTFASGYRKNMMYTSQELHLLLCWHRIFGIINLLIKSRCESVQIPRVEPYERMHRSLCWSLIRIGQDGLTWDQSIMIAKTDYSIKPADPRNS